MIKESGVLDKQTVLELWKQSYPTQDEEYLNFYFQHVYDDGVGILKEQDNRIVSSLEMNYHTIQFAGKQLKASYILGVSTLPDYRRRGHMLSLMESALDEAGHNCLITIIKAFNPKLYDQFGFEVVYYRKAYTIHRDMLHKVSSAHVCDRATPKELLAIYRKFILRFDACYVRDEDYYDTLAKELALEHKKMYVYRNCQNEVLGYIIFQKKKQDIIVQEAIYMESVVLKRLLKKALGIEKEITVMVSMCEQLEKIFPMVIAKKQPYMMARINNYELFNKLYNVKVKNVKEAFAILKKPLWCHEYY